MQLNFPIGHKEPIDLAGYRWDLPIFLIDGLFASCPPTSPTSAPARLSERLEASACAKAGQDARQLLSELSAALVKGFEAHALQRSPHMILLDVVFYNQSLLPPLARWALIWLYDGRFTGKVGASNQALLKYLMGDVEGQRAEIESGLNGESKKLLNLAREWVCTLMPHCLSKVDRVGYGILNATDLAGLGPRTPLSRRLMAVPFVGKDVPSASSEFAHVDVLIGLTIMAYRYEGLRLTDLRRIMTQLKADFSRQGGPRDSRPASLMFKAWLMQVAAALRSGGGGGEEDEDEEEGAVAMDTGVEETKMSVKSPTARSPRVNLPVSPLPLFQPNDAKQLGRLHELVRLLPDVLHHYLRQHVFPATMNFQSVKISACGHELGSSILFARRIGFSGTP